MRTRGPEQRRRMVRRTLRVRQTGREKGIAPAAAVGPLTGTAPILATATTLFPLLSWRTSGGMYEYVPRNLREKVIYLYFGRASTGTPRTPPAGRKTRPAGGGPPRAGAGTVPATLGIERSHGIDSRGLSAPPPRPTCPDCTGAPTNGDHKAGDTAARWALRRRYFICLTPHY